MIIHPHELRMLLSGNPIQGLDSGGTVGYQNGGSGAPTRPAVFPPATPATNSPTPQFVRSPALGGVSLSPTGSAPTTGSIPGAQYDQYVAQTPISNLNFNQARLNQGNYAAGQNSLAQMLQAQANGGGPNLGQMQLQSATDQNIRNAMAMSQSTPGQGNLSAQRNILENQAAAQQQAAGQSAQIQAQTQLGAESQLGGVLNQEGQLNNASNANQITNLLDTEKLRLEQAQGNQQAIGSSNTINAQTSAMNAGVGNQAVNNAVGAGTQAIGAGYQGYQAYNASQQPSNNSTPSSDPSSNDSSSGVYSGGDNSQYVFRGGRVGHYDSGGEVAVGSQMPGYYSADGRAVGLTPNVGSPSGVGGAGLSGGSGGGGGGAGGHGGGGSSGAAGAPWTKFGLTALSAASVLSNIASGKGAVSDSSPHGNNGWGGVQNRVDPQTGDVWIFTAAGKWINANTGKAVPDSQLPPNTTPAGQQLTNEGAPIGQAGTPPVVSPGDGSNYGNSNGSPLGGPSSSGGASSIQASQAAHGGIIPLLSGGPVPGKAKVSGDSAQNDTQPAMLSPGEVVLPRSVTEAEDAPDKAKAFLEAVRKGKGPKPSFTDVLRSHRQMSERVAQLERLCGGGGQP